MGMSRDMMRRLQKMQERVLKAQEELQSRTVEGTAGGDAVSVTLTGGLKVQSLRIDPEVVDADDVEMLEDLVTAALNEALDRVQALQSEHMASVAGGLDLPGLR
jgi:DNA-binding YbaB/EbfC family protein